MDPVTLAILTGVGGQALSQVGTLIPTEIERSQKRELERLKRLQGKGQLGLSEKEQTAMQGRLSVGSTQVQQQASDERNRILAGGGSVTGGQALQQAVAVDAQRAAGQERIAQTILEQDLAREEAQKERISAIEAAQSQKRAERAAAAASIAGAGLEAGISTAAQQKTIQASKDPSAQLIASTKQAFGFTNDNEARGYIQLAYTDPAAAALIVEERKNKIKSNVAPTAPAAGGN
jgi:hypothetical protein